MTNYRNLFAIIFTLAIASCSSQNPTFSLAPPYAPIVAGKAVPVVPYPDQLLLLKNSDEHLASNKKLVFDFWRTIRNAGQVEKLDKFVAFDYQEQC